MNGPEIRRERRLRGITPNAVCRAVRTNMQHLARVEQGLASLTPEQHAAFARLCSAVKPKAQAGEAVAA